MARKDKVLVCFLLVMDKVCLLLPSCEVALKLASPNNEL